MTGWLAFFRRDILAAGAAVVLAAAVAGGDDRAVGSCRSIRSR